MFDYTFNVVGVSTFKGEVKVRFGNDLVRVKLLIKQGHTDVELVSLPHTMKKPEAVRYLKSTELYQDSRFAAAIDAADEKYNGERSVKVSKKSLAPSLDAIRARNTVPSEEAAD
jgi:hypothetical protein